MENGEYLIIQIRAVFHSNLWFEVFNVPGPGTFLLHRGENETLEPFLIGEESVDRSPIRRIHAAAIA